MLSLAPHLAHPSIAAPPQADLMESRIRYFKPAVLSTLVIGDSRAALDTLLDLLADPSTDEAVRALIRDWMNHGE